MRRCSYLHADLILSRTVLILVRFAGSMRNLPDMMETTYDLVAQVPEGKVTTYGEVARALGDTVASRFVGVAMSMNQDIVRVPCRRVVQSDGSLGGYTGGGPRKKGRLLREEGVAVESGRIVNLDKILFKDFVTTSPLVELRRRQRRLRKHLSTAGYSARVSRVAGIDVAYDGDHAFAAMVVFDHDSGEEVEQYVIEAEAKFPYIPTYLAFREIPVIEALMKYVGRDTVLMYDGNGVLHPEGFGIASQLGVVFDLPTIGVAKKLLCGQVYRQSASPQQIRMNGKVVGYAVSPRRGVKPVYVSVGHKLSVTQAKTVTAKYLKHRIPEPTRRAHIVAEAARYGTNNK